MLSRKSLLTQITSRVLTNTPTDNSKTKAIEGRTRTVEGVIRINGAEASPSKIRGEIKVSKIKGNKTKDSKETTNDKIREDRTRMRIRKVVTASKVVARTTNGNNLSKSVKTRSLKMKAKIEAVRIKGSIKANIKARTRVSLRTSHMVRMSTISGKTRILNLANRVVLHPSPAQ